MGKAKRTAEQTRQMRARNKKLYDQLDQARTEYNGTISEIAKENNKYVSSFLHLMSLSLTLLTGRRFG